MTNHADTQTGLCVMYTAWQIAQHKKHGIHSGTRTNQKEKKTMMTMIHKTKHECLF
jgi:hypothetical protein